MRPQDPTVGLCLGVPWDVGAMRGDSGEVGVEVWVRVEPESQQRILPEALEGGRGVEFGIRGLGFRSSSPPFAVLSAWGVGLANS